MFRLLLVLIGLAVLPLVLVVVVLAALQSGAVREAATDLVSRVVPGVSVAGLGPGLPFRLDLAQLELADADGAWLRVANLSLAWSPAALVDGQLHVLQIGAERVHVLRTPAPGPTEPKAAAAETEPFSLPATLPRFAVDRVSLGALQLDAPVIGTALTLGLDGRAGTLDGRMVTADLALERLDEAGLQATLALGLDLADRRLRVHLQAVDASGLVAALAGDPAAEPARLALRGDGPLQAWPARLDAAVGALATAGLDLVLGLDGSPRLDARGEVVPGTGLVQGPLADLLGDGVSLDVAVAPTPDGIALQRLDLRTTWMTATGTAALGDGAVQAAVSARLDDLAPFAPLAGIPLAGRIELGVALDGALPLPPGTVTLRAETLDVATLAVRRMDHVLRLAPGGDGAVHFDLAGSLEGLRLATASGVLADDLRLVATGSAVPGGTFALDELRLASGLATVAAQAAGDLGVGTLTARADAHLPDLSLLAPLVAGAPAGVLSLALTADLGDGFGSGDLALSAVASDLVGLPAPLPALLGSTAELGLRAELPGAGTLRVADLTLTAANLRGTGSGTLALDGGPIDAVLALRVPDLGPVGTDLGEDLAGVLALDLRAAGTVAAPELALDVRAADLAAVGQRFTEVVLGATVVGAPDDLRGDLRLAAGKNTGAVTLTTPFRYTGERVVLDALALAAPGLRLDGVLDAAPGAPAVVGHLAGGSDDLRPLGAWLELPLAGRLTLDVDLAAPDGRQTVSLGLAARDLAALDVRIAEADVTLQAEDVLGALRLDADATVAGLAQGEVEVDRARLQARGELAAVALEVAAEGRLPEPFRITGGGTAGTVDGRTTATLTALQGEVARVPVRLTRPATVRVDGGAVELDGLELEVDTARVEMRGALMPERVEGRLDVTGVELARLEAFGAPRLLGRFDLGVRVTGTPAAPAIAGEAQIAGLGEPGRSTLDLASRFALRGGRLGVEADLAGLGEPPLRAEATVPVRFALAPFTLVVPTPLPLDARLVGAVDLAQVDRLLALDGQALSGVLQTDLNVGGTAARPRVAGGIELDGGRIEDVANGQLRPDLTVDVVAEADRIVIRTLRAGDGRDGIIDVDGTVTLGGDAVAKLDLNLDMRRFGLPQREDLYLNVSGTGRVSGTPADLQLFARMTVDSGEIRLPEPGAASFPTLDVTGAGAGPAPAAEATAGPGFVDLDVVVTVPGRLFVRGRGLVSEWGGEVAVKGDARAPRIVGGIGYRRGHLDLLGRRFAFREGTITLDGAFPPDPTIDVVTAVELSDIVAILAIRGPALDPEITATSEPPLPQDEVLARVIFDRGVERLNAIQAVRLAAAVRTLQGGGGGVLDRARSLLGLDTIDIGGEGVDDASVTAGAYVGDGVFFEVKQGLQPGSGQIRVQVELTPRISAETTVREDQTSSIGLRWSYDY